GEELGLHGALPTVGASMAWSRNPMQWNATPGRGFTSAAMPWAPFSTDSANVAAQDGVSGSMLSTYRGLIQVRRSSPALTHGSYRAVAASDPAVFAFLREDATERVLSAVNFQAQDSIGTVDLGALGVTQAQV